MADEFTELDTETPTEADIDQAFGSRYLGAVDIVKKIKTKIVKVRMEEVKDRETGKTKKRPVVYFANVEKPLILNATNKEALVAAFGKAPAGWLDGTVGILVDPNVMFGGVRKGGVRLRALLPPAAAKPAPKPEPQPTPKPPAATAANEWSDEKGDPGADPKLADFEPAE